MKLPCILATTAAVATTAALLLPSLTKTQSIQIVMWNENTPVTCERTDASRVLGTQLGVEVLITETQRGSGDISYYTACASTSWAEEHVKKHGTPSTISTSQANELLFNGHER